MRACPTQQSPPVPVSLCLPCAGEKLQPQGPLPALLPVFLCWLSQGHLCDEIHRPQFLIPTPSHIQWRDRPCSVPQTFTEKLEKPGITLVPSPLSPPFWTCRAMISAVILKSFSFSVRSLVSVSHVSAPAHCPRAPPYLSHCHSAGRAGHPTAPQPKLWIAQMHPGTAIVKTGVLGEEETTDETASWKYLYIRFSQKCSVV